MGTKRLDIDRNRAIYALDCVKKGRSIGTYGSQIESLPMMLHNSGLRNTLAFAYAKGFLKNKKEWKLVFEHIVYWFIDEKEITGILKSKFAVDFNSISDASNKAKAALDIIIKLDDSEYRLATQEVYALLNWLRKLVKGETENEQKEAENE